MNPSQWLFLGAVVAVSALLACREEGLAVAPESASAPSSSSGAEAPNAETLVDMGLSVHWVRNSAEYQAAVAQAYSLATLRLNQLAEASELEGDWAVALDADETVISNSLYQKERRQRGLSYTEDSWADWTERREATPLPGAVAFLDRVKELGGTVAIVTNRRHELCPDTEANFRSEGIPFDVILCRRESTEKEPRWAQVEAGTTGASTVEASRIVMWIGDNIEDFPELDQESRHEAVSSEFGQRFIVIPNPMYGSWMPNERF